MSDSSGTEPTLSAATAPSVSDEPLPVVERAHYRIDRELARGGMGRIFTARDRRLGREVAVKEVLVADEGSRARFDREVRLTARLQHPGIVSVYEAGKWPSGEPFYAMRLVAGRPLESVIAETKTLDDRLALLPHVLAVAEALAYAHDQRIIHRDLKPANVLVGDFGETVVIDWGLAKDLADARDDVVADGPYRSSGEGALTVLGSVMGTPSYMPVEQAKGAPLDERADVYAIGAILYHVLSGARPYEGRDAMDVVHKLEQAPPRPLGDRAPGAPVDLLAIVEHAMARDAGARYRTAKELADDLRRYLRGQLVASHRYTRWELVDRWIRRHRAGVIASTIALVAVAVVGTVSIRRIVTERDRAEAALVAARVRDDELTLRKAYELVETDPSLSMALLGQLEPSSLAWSGTRLVANAARARSFIRWRYDHPAAIIALATSVDGRRVVAAGADSALDVWDVTVAAPRTIAVSAPIRSLALSRDGTLAAIGGTRGDVMLVELATGKARTLGRSGGAVVRVAFSPDDTTLAGAGAGGASLWDVATGRERALTAGAIADVAFSPDGTALATAGADARVRVWTVATGIQSRELARGSAVDRVVFSPDGKLVASANGGAVWIEDRGLGKHEAAVAALAFTLDGKRLVSAGKDGYVFAFDIATGIRVATFHGGGGFDLLALAPDGHALAVAGDAPTVDVIDTDRDMSMLAEIETRGIARTGLALLPDGDIVNASVQGRVSVWSAVPRPQIVANHGAAIAALAFDGPRVMAITGDAIASARSADGRVAAAAFADGRVVAGARELHVDGARTIALSRDGRRLAVLADALHTFDLAAGAEAATAPAAGATALCFAADGHVEARAATAIACAADGHVAVTTAKPVVTLLGDAAPRELFGSDATTLLAFASDGSRLAAANAHGRIEIWSGATRGRVLLGRDVRQLVFAPDNRTLIVRHDDALRAWDTDFGLARVIAADPAITTFALGDDGTIAYGTRGGQVWTWRDDLPLDAAGMHAWLESATTARLDDKRQLQIPPLR